MQQWIVFTQYGVCSDLHYIMSVFNSVPPVVLKIFGLILAYEYFYGFSESLNVPYIWNARILCSFMYKHTSLKLLVLFLFWVYTASQLIWKLGYNENPQTALQKSKGL